MARQKTETQTKRFYEYFIQQRLKDKCTVLVVCTDAGWSHGQVGGSVLTPVWCQQEHLFQN